MQVCTYLDRRFVTSLLSRPNCFSRKASTICYAQPVKENKSLVVRSPCPSISSSMSLWRLLLKWQQRKNHRLSISLNPESVFKHMLYDTFFLCWQNQDLQNTHTSLWKITFFYFALFMFCILDARARAHRVLFWLWALTENVWVCWRAFCLNKMAKEIGWKKYFVFDQKWWFSNSVLTTILLIAAIQLVCWRPPPFEMYWAPKIWRKFCRSEKRSAMSCKIHWMTPPIPGASRSNAWKCNHSSLHTQRKKKAFYAGCWSKFDFWEKLSSFSSQVYHQSSLDLCL